MRTMDPIWAQLPRDLVYKICNMLTQVRGIPDQMKLQIEMQEMKLLSFYKSSRILFGTSTWVFVFNCLSTFVKDRNLFELEPEWSPRDESYYIWYSMTPEERDEFLEFDH